MATLRRGQQFVYQLPNHMEPCLDRCHGYDGGSAHPDTTLSRWRGKPFQNERGSSQCIILRGLGGFQRRAAWQDGVLLQLYSAPPPALTPGGQPDCLAREH
jgi:hypothetical protein